MRGDGIDLNRSSLADLIEGKGNATLRL